MYRSYLGLFGDPYQNTLAVSVVLIRVVGFSALVFAAVVAVAIEVLASCGDLPDPISSYHKRE